MYSPQNILNCLNEFPTGLIVISNIPSDDIEGGFINQIQYINVFARRLFNISQTEKNGDTVITKFKQEIESYHKREFDKLTNISLYDVVFGEEEIKDSGDSFFSEYNMIFVKRRFILGYILISVDDFKGEKEDIRKKLLRSISYQHLNTLHHELNNPLNSLITAVEEVGGEILDRMKLSVFFIKTVIKKFILYSKNIFDEVLLDSTCMSVFNLHFMFQKLAQKFKIVYDYKRINIDIDNIFWFLKNFSIRSEQYYLKEFIRNIFLCLYYEVPTKTEIKVKYDYVESSELLSMCFFYDDRKLNGKCKKYLTHNLIDQSSDCNIDINNKIKTIEISKEILSNIAKMIGSTISFPSSGKTLFVIEFSDVTKEEESCDSISEENVGEFNYGEKNISEVPLFNPMSTFSYLSSGLKGIGKNSSPITKHHRNNNNNNSFNPNTINNNNGNNTNNSSYLMYTRAGTHTQKKYIRNFTAASIPATAIIEGDSLQNNTDIPQQLQFGNKNILNIPNDYQVASKPVYEPIKNVSALRSVTRLCEKMRDPIIDNLKTHTFNNNYVINNQYRRLSVSENHQLHYLGSQKSDQFDKDNSCNTKMSFPGKRTQNNQSFFTSVHSKDDDKGARSVTNKSKSKAMLISPEFENFKTKRFPSRGILQITPLIRNELNLLKYSFSKMSPTNSPVRNIQDVQSSCISIKQYAKQPDILLVDDEEFNMTALKSLLKKEKLTADTACNGEVCIEKIQEYPEYKLIFMDVYMPVMDGISASKIIQQMVDEKKVNEKMAIIILSAHSKETVMFEIEKLQVVKKFVQKPLTRCKLKSILRDYYS